MARMEPDLYAPTTDFRSLAPYAYGPDQDEAPEDTYRRRLLEWRAAAMEHVNRWKASNPLVVKGDETAIREREYWSTMLIDALRERLEDHFGQEDAPHVLLHAYGPAATTPDALLEQLRDQTKFGDHLRETRDPMIAVDFQIECGVALSTGFRIPADYEYNPPAPLEIPQ